MRFGYLTVVTLLCSVTAIAAEREGAAEVVLPAQVDCAAVVADTVAELRAGAGQDWSEHSEAMARAAAGSACVKTQSLRYDARGRGVADGAPQWRASGESGALTEEAVGSSALSEPESEPPSTTEDASAESSVGGFTLRPLSGAPSKKPFERRQRDNDDS